MQENFKTTTNTIAFWDLPLLKRLGHPFLSPNRLFLLFSTCIERSLQAEPKIKNKLSSAFSPCLSSEINANSIFSEFLYIKRSIMV